MVIKLKDAVQIEELLNRGFTKKSSQLIANKGALELFLDLETRKITGIGFYPVGDRIVWRALKEFKITELFERSDENEGDC